MKNSLKKTKCLVLTLGLTLGCFSSISFAAKDRKPTREPGTCSTQLQDCDKEIQRFIKQLNKCQTALKRPVTSPKLPKKENDCSKDLASCDLARKIIKRDAHLCNKDNPKPVIEPCPDCPICPECPKCPTTETGGGSGGGSGGAGGGTASKGTCGPKGNDKRCTINATEKGNVKLHDLMVKKKDERRAAGNNQMFNGKQYSVSQHATLQKEINELECKLGYQMSTTTPDPKNKNTLWGASDPCY